MTKDPPAMNSALNDTHFLDRLAFHLRRLAGQNKEVAELSEESRQEQREKAREFIATNFPKPPKHQWTERGVNKRASAETSKGEELPQLDKSSEESNKSHKNR